MSDCKGLDSYILLILACMIICAIAIPIPRHESKTVIASGNDNVAIALDMGGRAAGALGCWLVLAEWVGGRRQDVKCVRVDGERIKANTLYQLKGGEFVEVTS